MDAGRTIRVADARAAIAASKNADDGMLVHTAFECLGETDCPGGDSDGRWFVGPR